MLTKIASDEYGQSWFLDDSKAFSGEEALERKQKRQAFVIYDVSSAWCVNLFKPLLKKKEQ